MAEVIRPIDNDELGVYPPVQELLREQAWEARRASGEYLAGQLFNGGTVCERPLLIKLQDGSQAVHYFSVAYESLELE